ncbi:MAG: Hydroxyacylglutathione hydrolase [Alphaproteobacteria bacterium]|nr:Hydroxyacylglutathione hydrolase [Alphaproteobacteria bacterium]
MTTEIEIVPCLTDNYAYLVQSGDYCAVVDPSEPAPVRAALARRGWKLTHILNTHHHLDHTGGNLELKQETGALVVGPGKDAARIPGIDIGVDERTGWEFDGRRVHVLEVPAHTRGAITFVIDGHAFTGDTLFTLGCGRLFEGDAAMMWESLSKLMTLPDDTLIWCGHEYTQSNGRFALTLEPGNGMLQERMISVNAARAAGKPTVPGSLGEEKLTNPFLRPYSAEIRKSLGMETASTVAVFGEIRERKNNF